MVRGYQHLDEAPHDDADDAEHLGATPVRRRAGRGWSRGAVPYLVIGGLLGFLWLGLRQSANAPTRTRRQQEARVESLRRDTVMLGEQVRDLQSRIDRLPHDATLIESVARGRYGWTRPGERLYRLVREQDRPSSR